MKVLIIGATGHVGASAVTNLSPRHQVTAVSRTTNPGVDLLEPRSIERLFRVVGEVDAVVSAFGSVPFRAAGDLDRADVVAGFTGKVLSQIDLIRIGLSHVRSRGSFTLTTGVVGREVIATGSVAAMANGAVEAWVRSAARELPRGIRVNAVSPTVLEEATGYHDAFPGFVPVPSSAVGMAFRRSVEGVESGRVFDVD